MGRRFHPLVELTLVDENDIGLPDSRQWLPAGALRKKPVVRETLSGAIQDQDLQILPQVPYLKTIIEQGNVDVKGFNTVVQSPSPY